MFYVFGSRLYGKVDEVPGLFHIATKFGHLNFVPLIPTQSYVVLSKTGNSFRGVPIPMSAKSVFVTWGRVIGFLAMVLGGVIALATASNSRSSSDPAALAGVAVMGAALFFFLTFYRGITRASFNRACQIARQIGMGERGYAELQRIYGQAAGRGFDVSPAVPVSQAAAAYPPTQYNPAAYGQAVYGQAAYGQTAYGQTAYAQTNYAPSNTAQPAYAQPAAQQGYAAAQYGTTASPAAQTDDDDDRGEYAVAGEGPTTFWLRGTHRQSGQAVCVPVTAADGRQARAMGHAQGIDVATVQYQDGRLA